VRQGDTESILEEVDTEGIIQPEVNCQPSQSVRTLYMLFSKYCLAHLATSSYVFSFMVVIMIDLSIKHVL